MITSRSLPNGHIFFEQKSVGPTIYLDQWMWCRLSEDSALRSRFVQTAAARQSCIMYSIASFMELALIEDQDQLRALEEVMDSLDFGFVEMNPVEVIALEKRHESETLGVFNGRHPAADQEFLDYAIRRHYPAVPRMSTILKDLKQETSARYSAMADRLEASWTPMIERARADSTALARAKTNNRERRVHRAGPPYTNDILRTLNFYLVANETMKMNRNEWMDILHLVVPIAYLEFVTLDKRWIHFVRNHLPLSPPNVASVYGPDEIDTLLEDINRDAVRKAAL